MDLTKVTAVAADPLTITEAFFSADTYEVADLVVPEGAMLKYANAEGWKNFLYIWDEKGHLFGDFAPEYGEIDLKDYMALRNYVLDDDFEFEDPDLGELTDLNNDGDTDLRDVYALRNRM
jgi:hypothetical protein